MSKPFRRAAHGGATTPPSGAPGVVPAGGEDTATDLHEDPRTDTDVDVDDGLLEVVWETTRRYTAFIPRAVLLQAGGAIQDGASPLPPDGAFDHSALPGDLTRLLDRYEVDAPNEVRDRRMRSAQ